MTCCDSQVYDVIGAPCLMERTCRVGCCTRFRVGLCQMPQSRLSDAVCRSRGAGSSDHPRQRQPGRGTPLPPQSRGHRHHSQAPSARSVESGCAQNARPGSGATSEAGSAPGRVQASGLSKKARSLPCCSRCVALLLLAALHTRPSITSWLENPSSPGPLSLWRGTTHVLTRSSRPATRLR